MTMFIDTIQKGAGSLYKQLADGIEKDILSGRIHPGEKLPTHRDLADALGVNVTTVSRGYKEAERRGLVTGTVGRGTFVAADAGVSTSMVPYEPYASAGMIELGLINPLYHLDPNLTKGLKKLCRRKDVSVLMHYSDPGGLAEHRTAGAEWANRFGLNISESNIVVCSGAQHALTCILSGLFKAGDRIATDSLVYPGMKTLSAMLGIRLVPVEMDQHGMRAESLDRICRRERINGLYLMPGVQNPTTITMPKSRRAALAEVGLTHGLLLIEDDAYGLTLPEIIPSVSSIMAGKGLYIAGTSKALAAGLRTAFLVVPIQYRRAICEAVLNTVWMTPPLNVELVKMWLKDGTVDSVIKEKRGEAAGRYRLAEKILHGYTFTGLETGFFLWLFLPAPWSGIAFEQRMRELGVNVFGAEKFAVGDTTPPAAVRISLTGVKTKDELAVGLQLVKRVLDGEHPSDFSVTM